MTQRRITGAIPRLLSALILVGLMIASTAGSALAQTTPQLEVEDDIVTLYGQSSFSVPVLLTTNSADILILSFTLSYDTACVDFDAVTNSDNAGLPDSITTHIPANFLGMLEATPGEVTMLFLPAPPISWPVPDIGVYNGTSVVDIEFDLLPACPNPNNVPFSFTNAEYVTLSTQSLAADTVGGTYQLRYNSAPTSVSLSPAAVDENQPPDTVVGTLSTDDPDLGPPPVPGEGHTYSLDDNGCSAPPAYTDNAMFSIAGDQIKTAAALDHELADTYNICVRSMDNFGLSTSKALTVTVNDLNELVDIQLGGANGFGEYHVVETEGAGYQIGQFTTIDYDQGRTYDYTLEKEGCGGGFGDNDSFSIDPATDKLRTSVTFTHEVQSIYNICVRTKDQADGTNSLERTFTLLIDNVNQTPLAVNDYSVDQPLVVKMNATTSIYPLDNDTDPDGDVLEVNYAAGGGFSVNVGSAYWIDVIPLGTSGAGTIDYTAKDSPAGDLSNSATIYLYKVSDDERGDCNSDTVVDAGDLAATVLEIGDNDPDISWWLTPEGEFEGSALGCDSNGLRNGADPAIPTPSVDAADLTCTVRLFFGETCGGGVVTTATANDPAPDTSLLHVPDGLQVAAGQTVEVPIVLDTSGQNIAAIAFTLSFDPAALSFDPTDTNGDGIPDVVSLNVPAGMAKAASVDAQAGHIQIAIFGTSLPLPLLQDGEIASIALQAKTDVVDGASALELTRVSLGGDQGYPVPVFAVGNNVAIGASGAGASGADNQLFLPQLHTHNE